MYVSGRSSEGSVSPKLCDLGSQNRYLLTGTKSSRPALSKTAATNLMGLFKFNWIKIKLNLKFSYLVTLVTFPVLNSYMWLVVPVLNSASLGHFHHHRRVYWMTPFWWVSHQQFNVSARTHACPFHNSHRGWERESYYVPTGGENQKYSKFSLNFVDRFLELQQNYI